MSRLRTSHGHFSVKVRSTRGQAISEYAAVIAFVAVLICMFLSIASGGVAGAVQRAFNAPSSNLNNIAAAAANPAQ